MICTHCGHDNPMPPAEAAQRLGDALRREAPPDPQLVERCQQQAEEIRRLRADNQRLGTELRARGGDAEITFWERVYRETLQADGFEEATVAADRAVALRRERCKAP